jgi:tetratricopeptide (TPR) repeat protein
MGLEKHADRSVHVRNLMKLSPTEIFKGKKIFFIGGTGFVGKVTLSMLPLFLVESVSGQQRLIPAGCPSVTVNRSANKINVEMTTERAAADKIVAEAQVLMRTPSGESVAKAISLYEQAIQKDPKNAPAFIFLARAHMQSQRYMSVPKKIAQARAWENLSKGRELDPSNIDGLHILADQILANNHDYKCAKKILETALKIDPKNARSNHYYSQLLSGMGKFDLAFQYADKAIAVADADSRNFVVINAGRPRYMAGQYDWVLEHYAKYLESNPNNWLAHFYRSLAFGAKRDFEQALVEAKKAMPNAPKGDAGGIGMLALAYANTGQKEKARELLNELLQRDARGEHVVEYRIAAVYEVLGERDEAFRWLGKDIDDRDGIGSWLVWLNYDPVWKEMRKDPRFKEIQKRAGW